MKFTVPSQDLGTMKGLEVSMARWNEEREDLRREGRGDDDWEILFEGPDKPVPLCRPVERDKLKKTGILDAEGRSRGPVRGRPRYDDDAS
jgi:hypothetical protein